MIEIVGLLGLVAFVLASLVVGGRILLLASRTRQLPETAISLSLILSGGIGTALLVVQPLRPDLSVSAIQTFNQAANLSNHVGYALLFLFVWRVFRPRELWAACLWFVSTAVLLIAGVGTAIDLVPGGGVPGRTIPADLWFWMSLNSRFVVYGWATFESFHYFSMLKRRLALGLADPVIVDRFFYWGVCTCAVCFIWINVAVQAVMLDSQFVQSISDIVSALLGFIVAGSLSYAFFPRTRKATELDSPSVEEVGS